MPLDDELQNPDNNQPRQGQQGDFDKDAVDKARDAETETDPGITDDVVGSRGSVLNDDASAAGENVASEDDQDFSGNARAEDDPQANREEQNAT